MQANNRAVSTRWYTSQWAIGNNSNTTPSTGTCDVYPVEFWGPGGTIQAIGFYKTSTQNRTALAYRAAIYTCGSAGLPDTLVADSGGISFATASTGVISANISAAVSAGTYFICVKCENTGTGVSAHPNKIQHNGTTSLLPNYSPYGWSGVQNTDYGGALSGGSAPNPIGCGISSFSTGAFPSDATGATLTQGYSYLPVPFFKYTPNPDGGPGWAWHGGDARWQMIA